jgi:hypothetical protein
VRAYLYFMLRDGWSFHLLSADRRTPLTGWIRVAGSGPSPAPLLRIIARLQGDTAQAQANLRQWSRGGVWVTLSPAQRRFFRIP